jgi:hypothetical protein
MASSKLLGVPGPIDQEAFSCWFSRLTLSQGASLAEVARYLELDLRRDIDRQAHGPVLTRVRDLCGLEGSAFAVQDRLMQSLHAIEPVGEDYMACAGDNKSRFRFCVPCLTEMRVPHYPIHWRFVAWRRCPVHDCLLEDACPECGRAVLLPGSLEHSQAGRAGYTMLDRCLGCAGRLTAVAPCLLQVGSTRLVRPWEDEQLENGRALLAALMAGTFRIEGRGVTFRLPSLREVERRRAFPVRMNWLSPSSVRGRHQALLAVEGSTPAFRSPSAMPPPLAGC